MTLHTIGGIGINLFARRPTPEELAVVVANMDSVQQAMFLIELGRHLRRVCDGRGPTQWQYIADDLIKIEEHGADYGSELVLELAARLKPC